MLRQVYVQNFVVEHTVAGPCLAWRVHDNLSPAGRYISSPYDAEAHYAVKAATVWTDYKVHLTETCDDDTPHLITNVETASAAVSDAPVTATIHASLATPYLRQDKTHLGHVITAAAIHVVRLLRWMANKPKTHTVLSAFAQLRQLAA
jgi:hypothetical protein